LNGFPVGYELRLLQQVVGKRHRSGQFYVERLLGFATEV
jgi:hypothetical protein